jgi:hypothetical protein
VILRHPYLLDEQDQRERIGAALRDRGVRHEPSARSPPARRSARAAPRAAAGQPATCSAIVTLAQPGLCAPDATPCRTSGQAADDPHTLALAGPPACREKPLYQHPGKVREQNLSNIKIARLA